MYKNMATSFLNHEAIKTTLPKAKELRRVVEPLITMAGSDSVANRRLAFSRLRDKEAVGKLLPSSGLDLKIALVATHVYSSAGFALVIKHRWQ